MFKLGWCVDGEWREHAHPPTYSIEQEHGASRRLLATAPGSDPSVLLTLADRLTPPLILLYVLHTPRGEGEPGRYQGRDMSRAEVHEFVRRFRTLLTTDGRFDLWVHSPWEEATLVWDRHNLIHGYGPVKDLASALRGLGFRPGRPSVPVPHAHNYHAACDGEARALLASQNWLHSPLEPSDEQ